MGFRVTGQRQLDDLARTLVSHAERRTITNRARRAIRGEAGVITRDQRESLAAGLPKRGGAAATITAEAKLSVRTALSTSRSTAVDIVDSWKGHDMRAIDLGTLRHPLWGNRGHWFNTSIRPLMLTKPVLRHRYSIRRAIARELDLLAEEIAKEV